MEQVEDALDSGRELGELVRYDSEEEFKEHDINQEHEIGVNLHESASKWLLFVNDKLGRDADFANSIAERGGDAMETLHQALKDRKQVQKDKPMSIELFRWNNPSNELRMRVSFDDRKVAVSNPPFRINVIK